MKQSELPNNRPDSNSVVRYVTAVGAALMVTFFDFVRNQDHSAVTKTAVALKQLLELTGTTSVAAIAAIFIFAAIGALLVSAYQPKETKESFLLGLTVLVVAGLGVPPATPKNETNAPRSAGESRSQILLPFSTAFAQVQPKASEDLRSWIFIDGPGQRGIPEVKVMVYSGVDGQLIINSLVFTKFSMTLPTGVYQVEVSRNGYRSVSFKINPNQDNAVYRVPMTEVKFFSAANFLGPQSVRISEDSTLTPLLTKAVSECQKRNQEEAVRAAGQAGIRRDKLDRDTRRLLCL